MCICFELQIIPKLKTKSYFPSWTQPTTILGPTSSSAKSAQLTSLFSLSHRQMGPARHHLLLIQTQRCTLSDTSVSLSRSFPPHVALSDQATSTSSSEFPCPYRINAAATPLKRSHGLARKAMVGLPFLSPGFPSIPPEAP